MKLAIQGLAGGGFVALTAVIFGTWDRRMAARKAVTDEHRGAGQDAQAERKAASEAMLASLQASRQDAEIARRELAAERETNRLQTVRLAEKRQAIALWEARARAMDNFAHWVVHEANGMFMRMYAAGKRGLSPNVVGTLPAVPSLETVTDWSAPPHSYATPEEIAASFVPPRMLPAPGAEDPTED
ncbi:hypothetical protein [Roseomonas sp. USHLN139]|uniref:hypothetical protein n=1 Tax=Roseomonas sp. USHLN139 TaxID=3081298 RepID=UPI003B01A97D